MTKELFLKIQKIISDYFKTPNFYTSYSVSFKNGLSIYNYSCLWDEWEGEKHSYYRTTPELDKRIEKIIDETVDDWAEMDILYLFGTHEISSIDIYHLDGFVSSFHIREVSE